MIWASWREFLAMGGYALYVWGSLGGVVLCLLGEIGALRLRQRQALAEVRAAARRGGAR